MSINLAARIVDLRRSLLAMGAAVEDRVAAVETSLRTGDLDLAERVKAGDDEIDGMQVAIETECMRVLALGHPVASDLRLVVTVLRMSTELEQMGDLARGIAKRLLKLAQGEAVRVPESLLDLAAASRTLVAEVMQLLAEPDLDRCLQVRREDKRIDQLNREVLVWSRDEIHRDIEHTQASLDMLSIAQRFERIADICTSLAEELIFLVEGRIVRHKLD
jgi:phosphate transport system protein